MKNSDRKEIENAIAEWLKITPEMIDDMTLLNGEDRITYALVYHGDQKAHLFEVCYNQYEKKMKCRIVLP